MPAVFRSEEVVASEFDCGWITGSGFISLESADLKVRPTLDQSPRKVRPTCGSVSPFFGFRDFAAVLDGVLHRMPRQAGALYPRRVLTNPGKHRQLAEAAGRNRLVGR